MADAGTMNGIGVRALSNEFRHASDAKLLKVTRMIDLLPERGQADALLDPIRDRLATLRPTRRMNRSRLLFTPFDRVLLPASVWRPGNLALPRSLLTPILVLLDDADASALPATPPFDEGDPTELSRTGRRLWEAAADCLDRVKIPAEWAAPTWQMQSGVSISMLKTSIPVVQLVLRQAYVLRTLPARQHPTFEPIVTGLLIDAARIGPTGWGIMLTLLFDAAPPDMIVRLALSVARGDRRMTALVSGVDQAITDMLSRLEDMSSPTTAGDQGQDAQTSALLLRRLEPMSLLESLRRMDGRPPDEQRRVGRLRQAMAAVNRTLFERNLSSKLQYFEGAMTADQASTDDVAAILAVEADARRIRSFVLAASRLEDCSDYDRMLEQATLRLVRGSHHRETTLVARIRLVELLSGSERALQLLTAGQATGQR